MLGVLWGRAVGADAAHLMRSLSTLRLRLLITTAAAR